MAGVWYCKLAGVITGPLKASELRSLAEAGKLSPEDWVRQGEEGPWVAARNVRGLFSGIGQAGSGRAAQAVVSASQAEPSLGGKKVHPASSDKPRPVSPTSAIKPEGPLLQAKPLSEPPPLPASPPGSVPTLPAQPETSLQQTAEPVLLTSLVSSSPVASGSAALSQPIPLPALLQRRRLQHQLLILLGLAGVAVVLGVVVFVLLSQGSVVGDRGPIAEKKTGERAKGATLASITESAESSEVSWVNASKNWIRRPGAAVRVRSIRLGEPPAASATSPGQHLLVEIEVKNPSEDKILFFRGWQRAGPEGNRVSLTDNQGHTYSQIASQTPLGETDSESVKKLSFGEADKETLVFRLPQKIKIEELEYLRLKLPGWAFPKEKFEPFYFQIPRKMIQTEPEEISTPADAEALFGPRKPPSESPKPPAADSSKQPAAKEKTEPPPIPLPKKDPAQEEFERLQKELEKEENTPPALEKEKSPKAESSEEQRAEGSEKDTSADSKPPSGSRSRFPGGDIMDHLDTPVPPKSSSKEKQ